MSWFSTLLFSKFKTLFILGSSITGAGAIATPVYLAGDKYDQKLFREFNPIPANYKWDSAGAGVTQVSVVNGSQEKGYNEDQSDFSKFPTVNFSNSQLIRGTKAYNEGNYVLYFGSEACPNCNNFLYSESESPKTWIGTDQKNLYRNGVFYETYSLVNNHTKNNSSSNLKNLKFIFFSDAVPSMENRNNDELAVIPWFDWDDTSVSQGRIKGDYRRYDESALQFRKIQSLLFYYFGQKAKGIPLVIIYKNGVPFVWGQDKIEDLEEEKRKAVGTTSSAQQATAEDEANKSVVFRYDLFKHLKFIFDNEWIWTTE